MNQVILFPRGQLTQTDQDRMQAVGVVAVEVDDPSKVTAAPVAVGVVPADDLVYALLAGVNYSGSATSEFAKTLLATVKAKRGVKQ